MIYRHHATPPGTATEASPLLSEHKSSPPSRSPQVLFLLLLILLPFLLILINTSPHTSPNSHAVTNAGDINGTLHLLSLNTFIRPFLVGIRDYKDERLRDMLPVFLTRDLLCLQELFWATGRRKQDLLSALSSKYAHSAHAPKPIVWDWLRWPPKPVDAGLAIMSARPVLSTGFHMFEASAAWTVDWFVQKGVLHACIRVDGGVVHVFTTHMQAGPYPGVRERQVGELVSFVEASAPRNEAVLLTGDFNIDGRRGYNDSRDSRGYKMLMGRLAGVGLVDGMRGLGQVVTTAGGLRGLTQKNERIDYLFVRPGDVGLVIGEGNVSVDMLKVERREYLTMSDHYAIVADVDVPKR